LHPAFQFCPVRLNRKDCPLTDGYHIVRFAILYTKAIRFCNFASRFTKKFAPYRNGSNSQKLHLCTFRQRRGFTIGTLIHAH